MNPQRILLIILIHILFASSVAAEETVGVSGTLPVIYIETENHQSIVSKTAYVNATYRLDPMGAEGIEALGSKANPLPMQIRGRGHSSWKGLKKPYKIKLDKKTAMMGMAANKHWALIKPNEGHAAGLQLGRLMNMAWVPDIRPVEVVLNGDYIGLYFLSETIRIDENRVNIYKQADRETDPDLICGGWLVEIDNYRDQYQITIPEAPTWNMTLRYHSPEILSDAQRQWLTNEFRAINATIYSTDKTSTAWQQYLDLESIARFFIIQEILDNPDGFHGSFYLHKDLADDAKWIAGPIWDLSCYFREKTDYTFNMEVHYTITPHWIGELIQYSNFCRAVKEVWEDIYPSVISEIYDYIDETILPLEDAWRNNCLRWNDDPTLTAEFRAQRLKKSLRGNIEWFAEHLPRSPYSSVNSAPEIQSAGPTRVYNLQGAIIGEFPTESDARAALRPGLYIINKKKILLP